MTAPTWGCKLLRVTLMLAAYGGYQAVSRSGHQRSPTAPGHFGGLRANISRTHYSLGDMCLTLY